MSKDTCTTFMTGATGFLGNYLLRDLLLAGRTVTAMLREPLDKSQARLAERLRALDVELETYLENGALTLVAGSLPGSLPVLQTQPDQILSCAASLQLYSNGNEEPFRTNVEGISSLLSWAAANDIQRIHAVSTAYVCGSYTESVKEVFHRPEPEFKTQYEKSKWQAESLLWDWAQGPGRSLTVYRPSFLVGDSQSGYTTQFGGFYQFARMLSILKQTYGDNDSGNGNGEGNGNGNGSGNGNGALTHVPLRIPARADDTQNFVPVDFTSRIIAEVMGDEALHGRIYHLTDPAPPTYGDIKSYLENYFKIEGGYFTDPDEVVDHSTPAESLVWEQYQEAALRLSHNPRFCQRNTAQIMDSAGISFPVMDQQRLSKLLDYAVGARWGNRNAQRQRS